MNKYKEKIGALFPKVKEDLAILTALWNEFNQVTQEDTLAVSI
jgi:hypothetical protein